MPNVGYWETSIQTGRNGPQSSAADFDGRRSADVAGAAMLLKLIQIGHCHVG